MIRAHKLDYSALIFPPTEADIASYHSQKGKTKVAAEPQQLTIGIILAFLIVTPMLLTFAIALAIEGHLISVLPGLGAFIGIATLVRMNRTATKRAIEKQVKVRKFALQNGLKYLTDISNPDYPGVVFTEGHGRKIQSAMRFPDGIEIGNYIFHTGGGRSENIHHWSYAKTKLPRKLPHILLDSKANNLWLNKNVGSSIDTSQVMQLEGDFNEYFTLYAPKQYERDVLYILTPDVMAVIVEAGYELDIEIVDDELYIYNHEHFAADTPDFYYSTLKIIDKIGSKLTRQADYYADERINDRAIDVVAPHGQRLRFKIRWLAVIVIIITGILMALLWSMMYQDSMFPPLVSLVIILAVIRFIRR